ncbi:MAG: hypothetical protein HC893_15530 [Chloroflexaceae bacterium]|nr:hypothetical protein [Chloroflexaceae bacterium]
MPGAWRAKQGDQVGGRRGLAQSQFAAQCFQRIAAGWGVGRALQKEVPRLAGWYHNGFHLDKFRGLPAGKFWIAYNRLDIFQAGIRRKQPPIGAAAYTGRAYSIRCSWG